MSEIMLHGVLNCPVSIDDPLSILQLSARAKQASKIIIELENQIEQMKCCENCYWGIQTTNHTLCNKHIKNAHLVNNCIKWETNKNTIGE